MHVTGRSGRVIGREMLSFSRLLVKEQVAKLQDMYSDHCLHPISVLVLNPLRLRPEPVAVHIKPLTLFHAEHCFPCR